MKWATSQERGRRLIAYLAGGRWPGSAPGADVNPRVVVGHPRTAPGVVHDLAGFSVATVHGALGQRGLLGDGLRPLQPGIRAAGTALTVLCPPGDNLMIHVAVEQIQPGDLLVVTTTAPSRAGYIGELLVLSIAAQGGRGIVTTTGVRDAGQIRKSGFPVWCGAISARGTAKATPGGVNLPISIEGTVVRPGDVVLADDDGVVCVPRGDAAAVALAAGRREVKEDSVRAALGRGELGLDLYGMRSLVERLGVEYLAWQDDSAAPGA